MDNKNYDMESVRELILKKDRFEQEIEEITNKLKPLEAEGYAGKLTDNEGYPHQFLEFGKLTDYRNLKRKLNELLNDYKDLMRDIQIGLQEVHKQARENGQFEKEQQEYEKNKGKVKSKPQEPEQNKENPIQIKEKVPVQTENKLEAYVPFAEIIEVVNNSPANQASILVGDLIVEFGTANSSNNQHFAKLKQIVSENLNKEIPIKVMRKIQQNQNSEKQTSFIWNNLEYQIVNLAITPRKWEGEGVLGCRFQKI